MRKSSIYCLSILLDLFIFFFGQTLSAQDSSSTNRQKQKIHFDKGINPADSVYFPYILKSGNYYLLHGNLFFAIKDTQVLVKDTTLLFFNQKNVARKDSFLTKMQEKAGQNTITKELYKQIVRPSHYNITQKGSFDRSDLVYQPFKGKTIVSINIKKIDMFGVSVQDTVNKKISSYTKFINKTHVNTRNFRIKNSLLFKVGDSFDPYLIADNEKILRSLPNIQDALFYIDINPIDTNQVDITIVTQDAYPLSIGGAMYDFNEPRLDLSNKNLMGIGHQWINKFYFNLPEGWKNNYNGLYRIENIGGTLINSQVEYYHVNNLEYTGFKTFRNFITPSVKYAGSFSWYRYNNWVDQTEGDTIPETLVQYRYIDSWLGRKFELPISPGTGGFRRGINISLRHTTNQFIERPFISPDSNRMYYNFNRILLKAGYSKQQNFRSNMIYSSGNIEDIPVGFLIEAIGGIEKNDYYKYYYLGSSLMFGTVLPLKFYVSARGDAGVYIDKNKNYLGAILLSTDMFTPLIAVKNIYLRQFIGLKYFGSHQQYLYKNFSISNNGIRNYPDKNIKGTNLFSIHLETVYYPRMYYYGFGSTYFTYADLAFISNQTKAIFQQPLYSGIGFGFRLRNDNFVFNSVEIRLTWYPKVLNGSNWSFYASSEQTLDIDNFIPGVPNIIEK
jgi:hypothetical protein